MSSLATSMDLVGFFNLALKSTILLSVSDLLSAAGISDDVFFKLDLKSIWWPLALLSLLLSSLASSGFLTFRKLTLKSGLESGSGFEGGAAAGVAPGGLPEDLALKDSKSSLTSIAAGVLVLLPLLEASLAKSSLADLSLISFIN